MHQHSESTRRDLLTQVDNLFQTRRSLTYSVKDGVTVPSGIEKSALALLRQATTPTQARRIWAEATEKDISPSEIMVDMAAKEFAEYVLRSPLPAVVIGRANDRDWSTISSIRRQAIEDHDAKIEATRFWSDTPAIEDDPGHHNF